MVSTATSASEHVRGQDLVLRICGTSRHGQLVRLRSGKCTIGSGPRCTLRLHAPGVQPLHCLILRGPRAAVVRRWATDTRLNGRAFGDADLVPGDRLTVGPIEFEVLHAVRSPEDAPSPPIHASRPPATPASRREIDELRQRLSAVRRQGRARARRLVEGLRTARRQIVELKEEHDRAFAEQAEQLARTQAELETERRALEDQRRQWDSERERAESESTGTGERLTADAAELEAQRRDLEEQRRRWEAERADIEQRLQEQAEQLDARQAELEAQRRDLEAERESFQQERDRWDAERSTREEQLHARAEELDARQSDLDARLSAIEAQGELPQGEQPFQERVPDEPPPQAEEPEEISFQEPSADSPASSEDLFRRLGTLPLAPDDELEEEAEPPASCGQDVQSLVSSPEPAEDESIDDYMARLLERVRSVTGESSQPSEASGREARWGSAPSAAPAKAGPAGKPPASRPTGPTKISPRAVAPEKATDLSAMRELANLSAHTAIEFHSRRVLSRAVGGKMLVTTMALLAGAGALWLWWSKGADHLVLYAALTSFVVTLFWGMQYARLLGRIHAAKSTHPPEESSQRDAENPEPPSDVPPA